ncbi:zinc finger and SCAN domain-containing protein 12 isoform X2 [Oryzias melastigma]|uniref:zinc finger and SCAN domain-containing protein 12 isoform X2 n=1 Tax=Oryzias melastigma TaxID=30732 RepID=UPI000CF7DACC|nr:zinc finger and SCAN domain-containing protein 12 isoform X2 [Oryzias melastigma]
MSMKDSQLTEPGPPDVLQPDQTSLRRSSRLLPSSPVSPAVTFKRKRRLKAGRDGEAVKRPSDASRSKMSPRLSGTSALKRVRRSPSLQEGQSVNGSSSGGAQETDGAQDSSQVITGDQEDGKTAEEKSTPQEEAEDESDDSEVSDMYEEEEQDDEEEEEDLSNDVSHSGDFHCSVCNLQLTSKFKLQDHMNLHTGSRPYCCAECGKRFCQIYNYRMHLRTHAKTKAECHWCRICLTGFSSQELLNSHLSAAHLEDVFYECDLCKRVFTSLSACEKHVELHKCMVNIACEGCGRNFSSEKSLARHMKKRCLRNLKCTDCSETFTKRNALLKHSFSHLGLLPYTCLRCRSHFRLANLYRQHKCEPQRIHCVACLRKFLNQEDFQQHKKDTGCWGQQEPNQKTDEIRCLECGQRFDTSEELKKHAGAHQRVLKCAECGKGFRSALLLMSHMGGHAGQSPCLCQACGLGFPHQQNYDGHLKTCGKTSQASSTTKKRPKSHREKKKIISKSAGALDATSKNTPDSHTPNSSDGLWRLTLDKEPPPGTNLVLFLPVCPSQTGELPVSSSVPQALSVESVQTLPQASLSPMSKVEFFHVNASVKDSPFEQLTDIKEDAAAPLDLSTKRQPSDPAPCSLPVKSEPEECDVSGHSNGSEIPESKELDSCHVKTEQGKVDSCSEAKRLNRYPIVLSLLNAKTAFPGPVDDVKREEQSADLHYGATSTTSSQLADVELKEEIKMEPDP